jgi:hypothetical protein
MKWIYISERPMDKIRKTKIFLVKTLDSDSFLGVIKWYGAWRKYCFFPTPDVQTVYEWICLRDIADFCQEETKKYKEIWYKA